MPVWCVRITGEDDDWVEADSMAMESGALIALAEDGFMVRAWAPGLWRTVRQAPDPDEGLAGGRQDRNLLIGLPRG